MAPFIALQQPNSSAPQLPLALGPNLMQSRVWLLQESSETAGQGASDHAVKKRNLQPGTIVGTIDENEEDFTVDALSPAYK